MSAETTLKEPMFHYPIRIALADIDHMGPVNNSVYLRWVQGAVIGYREMAAPAEAVARHLWVALKHEISYRKPASSKIRSSRT